MAVVITTDVGSSFAGRQRCFRLQYFQLAVDVRVELAIRRPPPLLKISARRSAATERPMLRGRRPGAWQDLGKFSVFFWPRTDLELELEAAIAQLQVGVRNQFQF